MEGHLKSRLPVPLKYAFKDFTIQIKISKQNIYNFPKDNKIKAFLKHLSVKKMILFSEFLDIHLVEFV